MVTERKNVDGARRNNSRQVRDEATRLPPLAVGAYAVACPACSAQPGQWCEAVLNLPVGTLLRDPHDARVQAAK